MIKVSKQLETCLTPKYMRTGEYEEKQGQQFTYKGIDMYLIHDGKNWQVVEKHVHKWIGKWQTTRKAALETTEKSLTDDLAIKIKEYIEKELTHNV